MNGSDPTVHELNRYVEASRIKGMTVRVKNNVNESNSFELEIMSMNRCYKL